MIPHSTCHCNLWKLVCTGTYLSRTSSSICFCIRRQPWTQPWWLPLFATSNGRRAIPCCNRVGLHLRWTHSTTDDIPNCSGANCPICASNTTCLDCKKTPDLFSLCTRTPWWQWALVDGNRELGLAVHLGGPLFIAVVVIIFRTIVLMRRKINKSSKMCR